MMPPGVRRWSRVVPACLLVFALGSGSRVQGQARSEFEVKAAYLYAFGRFVQWPPRAGRDATAFAICVLGTDPFGATLDATIAGATLRGRPVVARRLTTAVSAAACDVVFIGVSEEPQLSEVLDGLRQSAALTVSDIRRFAERGGMIQFVSAGNKVRFEINTTPARQAGLMLSSELLRVSSAVRGERGAGE